MLVELPAAMNSFVAGSSPLAQGQREGISPRPALSPLLIRLKPILSLSFAIAMRLPSKATYPKSLLTLRLGCSSDMASKLLLNWT